MSGWDAWAANVCAAGKGAKGAAIYDPSSGAVWGKSGDFVCSGGLANFDQKADGKDACCPEVGGQKFMFIRKTMDDEPANIFKKGSDSLFTTKGPSGSRVAVYVKEEKPETAVNAIGNYLKPYV